MCMAHAYVLMMHMCVVMHVCAYVCIIHVCEVMYVCMACICLYSEHVCVVMHVHVGMRVCVTHACVWSDACIMVHASMCGACKYVWSMYVCCTCMCVAMHAVCLCTCTHLLDRLISDILYGPLPLRSLIELHTASAS